MGASYKEVPSKEDFENAYSFARNLIERCDDEAIVKLSMEYNKVSDGYSNAQVDLAMARFMGVKLSCHPDPTVGLLICNLLMQWMLEGAIVANKKEAENATKQ